MAYRVKLMPSAKAEIQNVVRWYNQKSSGLGKRFHSELKADIERLKRFPFHEVRYNGVRCLPLKRFPFMIHFEVFEDERVIRVHAVLHTSLNPDSWQL